MPIFDNFSFRRPSFHFLITLGILVGWILVLLLISGRISLIFTHIPFDYNEGWNAYLGERAVGLVKAPLYPDPDGSLIFNNYPPLSFYLVGGLGYLIGDMVWAGRILSLVAWLGTMGLVYRLILQAGGNRLGAHIGILLFALYSSYFFHSYIAMNDPQWMAHFCMMLGLSLIIKKQTTSRVIMAALCFITGGLIKHNLLALPLAVTGWLFLRDRKLAMLWLAMGLSGILIALAGFTSLYDSHFMIADILHHKRVITFNRLPRALGRLVIFIPLAILAFPLLIKSFRSSGNKTAIMLAAFALLSLFFGIFESLGEGVSYNAFFETLIAFSIITGLIFSNRMPNTRSFLFSAVAAFLPVLATAVFCLPHILDHEYQLQNEKQQWNDVITRIRATKTPVICDISEICYWAGKDYRLDFFNYYQAVKRGASLEPLNRAIITPIPATMVKVTISKKCPTFLLLWQMILSHPHKTQTLSPHVEMIEMIPPKQKN